MVPSSNLICYIFLDPPWWKSWILIVQNKWLHFCERHLETFCLCYCKLLNTIFVSFRKWWCVHTTEFLASVPLGKTSQFEYPKSSLWGLTKCIFRNWSQSWENVLFWKSSSNAAVYLYMLPIFHLFFNISYKLYQMVLFILTGKFVRVFSLLLYPETGSCCS